VDEDRHSRGSYGLFRHPLSADGAFVSAAQLAAAAGLSASFARALIAQFQARPPAALQNNGHPPAMAEPDLEASP
jgi:hypothetical protein